MIDKKWRIFASRRESNNFYLKEKVDGENCIPRTFIIRTIHSTVPFQDNQSRKVGHVTLTGGKRKSFIILIGKLEGKRPCGRSRHRSELNINR